MHLRRWGPAVAIAVVMGAPASTHASEIHIEAIASATTAGEYVVFTAAPGERNRVGVRYSGTGPVRVRVQDSAGVQARGAARRARRSRCARCAGPSSAISGSSATATTG